MSTVIFGEQNGEHWFDLKMAVITGKEGLLSFKHGIFRYSIGELERTRPSSCFRVGSDRRSERKVSLSSVAPFGGA